MIFFFLLELEIYFAGLVFFTQKTSSHGFIFIFTKWHGSVNFFSRYCLRRIFILFP